MKRKKYLTLGSLFVMVSLFLSGCVQRTASGKPYGFVYEKLAVPTQHIMDALSNWLGGSGNSYGWAIILITFIHFAFLLVLNSVSGVVFSSIILAPYSCLFTRKSRDENSLLFRLVPFRQLFFYQWQMHFSVSLSKICILEASTATVISSSAFA